LNPLPIVFWSPIHGISNPLSMVFWPLSMVYRNPYPWYFDPPKHGISNPLSMVYWTPYPWYIEPSIHGISNIEPFTHYIMNPLLWYFGRNEGVQFTMMGFKIQWSSTHISTQAFCPWVSQVDMTCDM
jgi:hypothetical protein